jgi:hypothetical protein
MTAELNQAVTDHPAILRKTSLGTSYEGRDIPVIKISDNVATDENEPEVLYTAHQHAREHLTVEMALYLIKQLTDNYGTDARITGVVNSREIWIVPDMNPDGREYDIATGAYRSWRKNRQPNSGSSNIGTDLNRNWGYNWGCCGAGANDIDGGTTSVRSPSIALPASGTLTLGYSWYLGHGSNASSADFFRVSVVTGSGTTVLFTAAGAASDRDAAWSTGSVNLTQYAGQNVQILIEAADASTASLVEAGVDNVTIRQT